MYLRKKISIGASVRMFGQYLPAKLCYYEGNIKLFCLVIMLAICPGNVLPLKISSKKSNEFFSKVSQLSCERWE